MSIMTSEKPPYICEPTDQSSGRPATFIYLHGYADDAEGIPLGTAQQFQWHSKMPWLRWVLPNAPIHADTRERAWYKPKALPNSLKPRVPVQEDEEPDPDDEDGILKSLDTVDQLVQAELDRGVDPSRIVVGGFSQVCAMSLVWGLTGKTRTQAGGVVCLAGYFPLADRISALRQARGFSMEPDKENEHKKWLYQHGSKDVLVPGRLFQQGQEELRKWVKEEDIQARLYDGMGHSTNALALRDLLRFLESVVPA